MRIYTNRNHTVSLHLERLVPGESKLGFYVDATPLADKTYYAMLHLLLFTLRLFWHRTNR